MKLKVTQCAQKKEICHKKLCISEQNLRVVELELYFWFLMSLEFTLGIKVAAMVVSVC